MYYNHILTKKGVPYDDADLGEVDAGVGVLNELGQDGCDHHHYAVATYQAQQDPNDNISFSFFVSIQLSLPGGGELLTGEEVGFIIDLLEGINTGRAQGSHK